jgi:hypothetical protein
VKVGEGVRSDAVTIEAATPEHLRLLLDDVPGSSGRTTCGSLRGLATAAAAELIARPRAAGVHTVLAHTLAEANPSTGVPTGLGFTRTAELDSEDGPIWRWELPLPPGSTNRGGA